MRFPHAAPPRLAALAIAIVALAACGDRSHRADPLADDLKRDLDLVGGDRPELASSVMRPRGPQIISDIESVPLSSRAPHVVHRRHVSPRVAPVPTRVAVGDVAADARIPARIEISESAVPAPPPSAPRPVPIPVSYPTSGPQIAMGGDQSEGPMMGPMIGVILRGGPAGRDRCDPRTHAPVPTSVGGIFISSRYPMIGRGTF